MRIAAGELVARRYLLDHQLAQGGMGSVWVARHVQLGALVAVKFMDPRFLESPAARARFEREARTAAQIQSPHVVKVFDYGIEDETPYLVMELLDGEDLGARLKRRGPLSLPAAADIVAQVARALRQAHEAGIVHRDLKPANVFLARSGEVEIAKVLDFGLAKPMDLSPEDEATKTEEVLGSPQYMSPEHARGTRDPDPRSDLFSLGVIAYRLITGKLPFSGRNASDILVKICTEPAPPPSVHRADLPLAIDRFFVRALAKTPEERFQSAAEMAQAFALAAGVDLTSTLTAAPRVPVPVSAPIAPVPMPSARAPSRTPWGVLTAFGIGIAAVIAGLTVRQRASAACAGSSDVEACRTACALRVADDCERWHALGCESAAGLDPGRVEHCEIACRGGRAASCAALAEALSGRADLADRRMIALEQGCNAGDRDACLAFGVGSNDARGMKALEQLCKTGFSSSCQLLAARLAYGYTSAPPMPGDAPRFARAAPMALSLLEKGCDAGILGDCEDAAALLLEGEGIARDDVRARALFERAIAPDPSPPGGSAADRARDAKRRGVGLVWALERGRGGPRSEARAVALAEKLCGTPGGEGSLPASCLQLAYLLRKGRGVARDPKRAEALVKAVCNADFKCFDEARRWQIAWLRPRDLERAFELYDLVCELGDARGCEQAKSMR
jgi:serine/threonine-protein kinase